MSSARLTVRVLGPDDARLSYALVRLTRPDIDLDAWCDILAQSGTSEASATMLGVVTESGCLIGLLALANGEIETFATSFMLAHHHDAVLGLARDTAFRLQSA